MNKTKIAMFQTLLAFPLSIFRISSLVQANKNSCQPISSVRKKLFEVNQEETLAMSKGTTFKHSFCKMLFNGFMHESICQMGSTIKLHHSNVPFVPSKQIGHWCTSASLLFTALSHSKHTLDICDVNTVISSCCWRRAQSFSRM